MIESEHLTFAQHFSALDKQSVGVVEKHAPIVSGKKKDGTPPWLDVEYKRNRALWRKYESAWRKSRTDENMLNYTQQKKLCMEMALQKQTAYYSKLVKDAGRCQKTLWR